MIPQDQNNTKLQDGNENIINLPEHSAKKDPAGTDPNRYGYFKDNQPAEDNLVNPEDGSTDEDRLLSPDKGER